MSDELRQIEIETARIKLERERLALEDELKKRQRVEEAKNALSDAAGEIKDRAPGVLKKALKIALWLGVVWAACVALFIASGIGGPKPL